MGREIRRTRVALGGGEAAGGAEAGHRQFRGDAITRVRAIVQVALTAILLPLTIWVVFGPGTFTTGARDAASALLGALVTFWLKD